MEEKALFTDDIRESKEVSKYIKKVRIMILVFMIFFLILSIFLLTICLIKKKYLVIIVSAILFVISIILLIMFFIYAKKNYSYLYIYEDRIVIRPYGKKEVTINITPSEYSIILWPPFFFNLRYGITLEFQDKKYNTLAKYKSLTLYPSEKNKPQKEWEKEIFEIGCKVVDRNKLIINK